MTFIEATNILQQGFPIKHPVHGRLYRTPSKDTFHLHMPPTSYRRVVCTDLEIYILLPINSEQHKLLTDLSFLEHSEDWEISWNS